MNAILFVSNVPLCLCIQFSSHGRSSTGEVSVSIRSHVVCVLNHRTEIMGYILACTGSRNLRNDGDEYPGMLPPGTSRSHVERDATQIARGDSTLDADDVVRRLMLTSPEFTLSLREPGQSMTKSQMRSSYSVTLNILSSRVSISSCVVHVASGSITQVPLGVNIVHSWQDKHYITRFYFWWFITKLHYIFWFHNFFYITRLIDRDRARRTGPHHTDQSEKITSLGTFRINYRHPPNYMTLCVPDQYELRIT